MSRVSQAGRFFAVGGAVQPDRPCYIERPADEALLRGIHDRQFCYVLAPKASGKSSLMARAVRDLRAEGQLVAVVDLAQIGMGGERAGGAEAGRWSYSIAYRVLRELRLKVDLQAWWQTKSALAGEQRLAEFFWEVVLPNTSEPVTVFLDEIERAVGLPFAKELFGGIRSCYSGRTTEPDLERLNFVVLGVAAPRQLCPDATISPFVDGRRIELDDFSLDETYGLAPGFGEDTRHGRVALREIFPWASGQPFLTQKIARGLARRGGMPSKLDGVLKNQFLGPGARRNEALLSHIRTFLTGRTRAQQQALALLGRVVRGEMLLYDPGSLVQQVLFLSGVIRVRADGRLAFRNKLFERVFGRDWVTSALPFNWRRWSVAATLVAALIGGSIWYVRYVPRPYIETLTAATADLDAEMQAHDRLGRLPGFAGVADRLLASVVSRRSRAAETFADVGSMDAVLRGLAGYADLADQLMDEYWIRRAEDAIRRERRDEALLLSARAAAGTEENARRLAASLVGDDYRSLLRSFRLAEAPARWEVDWQSGELALVDLDHQVRRLRLNSFGKMDFENRLTALQHLPVSREITVNEPGSAGAFQLRLTVDHPAPEELLATLQAPSGAQVSFAPPAGNSGAYTIAAGGRSPLAILADENRRGVWRLTLVDRGAGSAGQLIRWGLYFAEEVRGWEDQPQGLALSDPLRTDQVDVELSVDGRLAIARPTRQSVVGAVSLWDLRTNSLVGDVQIDAEPDYVALTGDTSRILAVAGDRLELWDAQTGALVSRVGTQTGFMLPPALTDSGGYVVIAEQLDEQDSLYSLLRTADGELVSSVAGLAGVTDWMLGPDARYLVLIGPSRLVRVMDPRSGEVLRELPHQRDPIRLVAAATGDLLLTIDDIGNLFVWHLSGAEPGSAQGVHLGQTGAPESVSIAADASRVAYQALTGQVVVREFAGLSAPMSFRVSQEGAPIRTRLAPDGSRLLTYNEQLFQLWHLADSGPAEVAETELTAIGLDAEGGVAVLGFLDGHIGVIREDQAVIPDSADPGVNFIGHQGSITSIAVNASGNVIASGGSDGLVRTWELDSGAPTAPFMRHPQGPVHVVTISSDGRWLASGAEFTARVWQAADGELVREVPVSGRVVSIAVDSHTGLLSVGDQDGNVFLTGVESAEPPDSVRVGAAATALAFGFGGSRLVTGDAAGIVQLWGVESLTAVGEPHNFVHSVQWLGFSGEGRHLLVQTDHWMHRFSVSDDGLVLTGSRLLDPGMEAGAALLVPDGSRLRMIAGRGTGEPQFREMDMVRLGTEPLAPDSVLLSRNWSRILGLRVAESGEVVAVIH